MVTGDIISMVESMGTQSKPVAPHKPKEKPTNTAMFPKAKGLVSSKVEYD
jgi:hypothetical protein